MGVDLLLEYAAPGVDPLSPGNPLIYAFSPLVGTPLTTSAKFALVSKSPLTERVTDALSSSHFAIAAKRSGMDALVLLGHCETWSVLVIDDDSVRLISAEEWMGRSAAEAADGIRRTLGAEFRVSAIGPAGENQVLFATVSNDGRHAGRGGLGAVMGSKRLKAIAVRGSRPTPLADASGVLALARNLSQESFGPATEKYRELGTVSNLLTFNRIHALPTRNFREARFESAEAISAESLEELRGRTRSSCAACTIGCEQIFPDREGVPVRMEYESLFAMGSLLGVGSSDDVLRLVRTCDDLGLDTISAGGTLAWAIEATERGVLNTDLAFGAVDQLDHALKQIGAVENELGRLLSRGSRRASEEVGGREFAMHVKGLELPGYEPRTLHAMALGLAVGTRGADHNKSGAYEADLSGISDRYAGDQRSAAAAVETEDRAALLDSLILCKFLRGVFDDIYEASASMLEVVCGWTFSGEDLRRTAVRIVEARKRFNIREGWTRDEDTLPAAILNRSVESEQGGSLTPETLSNMIDEYYRIRGWNADGTLPDTRDAGVDIPVLCHDPRLEPAGVCRMCVVDTGGRVMAASCVRECEQGMEVDASSERVLQQRRTLTELLLADHPVPCEKEKTTGDCELEALARDLGVSESPYPAQNGRGTDFSSAVIRVDHQACILCDRCIRGCDDVQNNEVIGRSGKGYGTTIGFDLNTLMGESTCVSCGECLAVCPTGALTNQVLSVGVRPREELKAVDTVCPYCGVGCALTYYVDENENQIVYADGRESIVNDERLCVKGRYGFDYPHHAHRLTKPLIRVESAYPKGPLSPTTKDDKGRKPGGLVNYDDVMPAFREATWEEALALTSQRLRGIRDEHGSSTLAGFGSAKCSNEEAYLFQKLIRAVFGTNNIDHCTRLCHASSVSALLETVGSGAVSNVFADIDKADVALITGTNTTSNHPVAATFMKEASKRGTKMIIVDPKRPTLADHAYRYVRIKSGTDVAFYNGVMHVIWREGLVDESFIAARTENYDALVEVIKSYPPERAAELSGVTVDEIEDVALTIGNADAMMVYWGMGIAQHAHGTDNARCLISIVLMTGNVGRPGTGLHPLRGQNNVQGASDAGLVPIVYPDYQNVTDPDIRKKFERAWGTELDPNAGLTVVEIMDGAKRGDIKGMYMMGENPFMSDPNQNKVRGALSNLDFLVVQDIFLTETAEFADVILPATTFMEKEGTYTNSDRRVQIGRKVLDAPGEARIDWEITRDIANGMGADWNYESVEDVFHEFTELTRNYKGLSYENLGMTGKLWPCPDPANTDGTRVLFSESFPRGLGKFSPAEYSDPVEMPDEDYPYILNTGRELQHWHTGTMTRRSKALSTIAPEARIEIHPSDLEAIGAVDGEFLRVASRRGTVEVKALASEAVSPGTLFLPFHYREAAANLLTIDALDPFGKIPEYKVCAIRVEKA
jgi:formate dehydrogenase major subunit